MTRIKDVINVIEDFAPLYLQEDFDNSGFIVGDKEKGIDSILIALDVTSDVVKEAIDTGANLIVSHHPLIFKPLKRITTDTIEGEIVIEAIKNDIAIYAAHTNVDNASDNISRELVQLLGVKEISPLIESCGTLATLTQSCRLREVVDMIRDLTGDTNIRSIGNLQDEIKEIIFANGANGSDENLLIQSGMMADAFITAELKYHIALKAKQLGINIIECGHYESEKIFMNLMERKLKEGLNDVKINISKKSISPYNIKE